MIPILLAFGEITHFEEGFPNKDRYGYAVSAKPRSGTISPETLCLGKKSAQKPNDGQIFMTL